MITRNQNVETLIYHNKKKLSVTSDDIPSLVPNDTMTALLNGDAEPYYKIEAIDYPAQGSGGIYEGDFFNSFVNGLKERPYPGSKRGHEFTSRPSSDFYTVGGSVVPKDENSGTAYLKMYIPKQGDTTSNDGFIRDAKAGIVNFSLVTYPEYNVTLDKDGNQTRHFTASKGFERNDAVEYGTGAMEQQVNSAVHKTDFETAKKLINDGHFKRTGNSDGDIIQNGVVMRPVLRAILSRADVENKSELSELVSMIDRKHNGGKTNMDEELETIKNCLVNGTANINVVAEKLGIANKLRNENDDKNAAVVKELNSMFGSPADLLATVKAVKEENAATAAVAVENAVIQAFGQPKIKNGKGEDVANKCYVRAMELCANKSGDELKKAIENAKSDVFIKDELSMRADNNSDFNIIVDSKKDNAKTSAVKFY